MGVSNHASTLKVFRIKFRAILHRKGRKGWKKWRSKDTSPVSFRVLIFFLCQISLYPCFRIDKGVARKQLDGLNIPIEYSHISFFIKAKVKRFKEGRTCFWFQQSIKASIDTSYSDLNHFRIWMFWWLHKDPVRCHCRRCVEFPFPKRNMWWMSFVCLISWVITRFKSFSL